MKKALLLVTAGIFLTAPARAQLASPIQGPADGRKMEFEIASVKPSNPDNPRISTNFPMGPGDMYSNNGGRFEATGFPLSFFIQFAYKMPNYQWNAIADQLPDWAKRERFDIEAKAEGQPTKDEMRLMVQALLADRFKMTVHYEQRQAPVFWLVLDKPGKLGPRLKPHDATLPCSNAIPGPETAVPKQDASSPWPATCGGLGGGMSPDMPGQVRIGARNVTLQLIASQMTGNEGIDRPVVDKTGLEGRFDWILEFFMEGDTPATPGVPQLDSNGPTYMVALKEQLGLKLVPGKGPINIMVVDHVERPSPN